MSRKRKQSDSETEETEPQQPQTSWMTLATEDEPKLAVPIGPRFQVDLPEYNGPSRCQYSQITQGLPIEQTWPMSVHQEYAPRINTSGIGEGRPGTCSCSSPGSVQCFEYHVNEERNMLETELGPAYQLWRVHESGNVVAESWTRQEQETFHRIVKENPISAGDGFMKAALRSLPLKNRASIVSYYLNVYVPRRICKQTRSGCTKIDTDDDEEEDSKTVDTKSRKGKEPVNTETSSRSRSYLSGCR